MGDRPETCKCGREVRPYVQIPVLLSKFSCPHCEHEWEMTRAYYLPMDLKQEEEKFAQTMVAVALEFSNGSIQGAARVLGMERTTLVARIRRWGWSHSNTRIERNPTV